MTYETCTDCNAETGRAGRGEDSLYAGDFGPYCESCWDDLRETLAEQLYKAAARMTELQAQLAEAREAALEEAAQHFDKVHPDSKWIGMAIRDLRRAARALETTKPRI